MSKPILDTHDPVDRPARDEQVDPRGRESNDIKTPWFSGPFPYTGLFILLIAAFFPDISGFKLQIYSLSCLDEVTILYSLFFIVFVILSLLQFFTDREVFRIQYGIQKKYRLRNCFLYLSIKTRKYVTSIKKCCRKIKVCCRKIKICCRKIKASCHNRMKICKESKKKSDTSSS